MDQVRDKVAFITGGAGGIGLAIARSLGRRGARVMLADIVETQLDSAVADLRNSGIEAAPVVCDVADAASVREASERTLERFGAVHILINNAGVFVGGRTGNIPLDDWRWIVDVNLMGVVHGVETFVPIIAAQNQGGYVINTASMAGHWAVGDLGPYNATKFAVVGYSETLRRDLRRDGIGVSVLCPALVRTRIHESMAARPSTRTGEGELGEHDEKWMKAGHAAVESGIDPEIVSEWVVDCMAARRFYIFTHPEMASIIDARAGLMQADYQACLDDPRFGGGEDA